jgi:hypothetical protein
VRSAWVDDAPVSRARGSADEVVKSLVQLAHRRGREIDDLDRRVLALGDGGHQTYAFSHA